ncbi:sulfotransferase domain-containing protein [Phenylobacterium sp.]|uniref:sulfotransferase domain-containing protein n=1 Tax=Phenylobacterium sp. TaxID=1871053 RepID=UPI0012202990|nr:sulfotransferase domain-containing protein [Phenylobacterium sp.]THD58904.1 MAG: sulfotransferase [Phenylobacterium sp.]
MAEDRVAFIIAGVQKGGTTALFDYLDEEPGLSLSRGKEVHFFDDAALDWAQPDYGAYHAAFAPFDGRPRGEATPAYLYWPGSLERIRAYNPAMKLIVMLRDPVERAWSHWKMEYARGAETEPFAWCVRQGRQRLFDAEPWGFHREFSYVERGFYGEQVAALLGLFPREQLLLLRASDLRRDPAAVLAEVRRFLGLPPGPAPSAREANVGREMDYGSALTAADVAHLRGVYARDAERLADLTGLRFA